jgi:lipooligosaccharide transport system ATP-binding protein
MADPASLGAGAAPPVAAPDAPVISLRGVSKRFGPRRAVDGLDLDVPPGICFGLLGPNGAGKTTTLRMIYGVTPPSAGSIHVFGLEVSRNPRAVRARLGVTLQENVQIESLSPEDNLRIFGRYHLLREPQLGQRVEELLDFLELRSHQGVPVVALSGGFQRRLAIAMALMNEPELLVLDEPTTGLDPAVRLALWSRVRALRAAGTSVLLTTHYMDEAERLCDRVAIMSEGRAVAEGSPSELIARHVAPDAVELDCSPEEKARMLAGARWQRLRSGGRLVVYTTDGTQVVERIHRHDGGDRRPLVVRPANLEDVFLAATGTALEEHP